MSMIGKILDYYQIASTHKSPSSDKKRGLDRLIFNE
jgi:hypothetical protein